MNIALLNQMKQNHIERIKNECVRINTHGYIFLKFILVITIFFGLILGIYFLALCIFSSDQVMATRFYMGVLFLVCFSYSLIMFIVYSILFSKS